MPTAQTPDALEPQLGDRASQLRAAGQEDDAALLEAAQRMIRTLRGALKPLAEVAAAFHDNSLDDARPEWGDTPDSAREREIMSGRGGRQLLTLGDALAAHAVLFHQAT